LDIFRIKDKYMDMLEKCEYRGFHEHKVTEEIFEEANHCEIKNNLNYKQSIIDLRSDSTEYPV